MKGYRVRYQTLEIGGLDIHLRTLRDLNQYSDAEGLAAEAGISPEHWPLFGVVWASSRVLAQYLLSFETEGLRILEVGCGIGLVSLMLHQRNADITATDRHPEVAPFLQINAELNGLTAIPYHQCEWEDENDDLGLFDLILGSDLLYELGQAEALSSFIDRHARTHCNVLILGPGRPEQGRFRRRMVDLGYSHTSWAVGDVGYLSEPFSGQIQRFVRA